MTHALLRYGDLTASGIAGGRTGLNVDSAATRAATRSDEKIKAIFAVNDSTKMACMVGRTSKTAEEEHGWLFDPTCCAAVVVKWIFEIGKTSTEMVKLHVERTGSPTS